MQAGLVRAPAKFTEVFYRIWWPAAKSGGSVAALDELRLWNGGR